MIQQPDVLVVLYCTVSGENEDLLGVDETAITELNWMAINAVEKKVNMQWAKSPKKQSVGVYF